MKPVKQFWSQYFLISMVLVLTASQTAHGDSKFWEMLASEDNMVVLMRHSYARGGDSSRWDSSGACKGERLLTSKGRIFASNMGRQFREHKIDPVVFSSPLCRCRDTSALVFRHFTIDPVLREIASAGIERTEAALAGTRALLVQNRGKRPVVLVTHQPNVHALTMELIDIGELVVGKISGNGDIRVLGKIDTRLAR